MSVSLRLVDIDCDIQPLTALFRMVQRDPPTEERVWAMLTATLPLKRMTVAIDTDHTLVGYCSLTRLASAPADQATLWIASHPDYRRRGIAQALYADVLAVLPLHQITDLRARVEAQDIPSLAFAQQRGFTVARHLFRATLDLGQFDAEPFHGCFQTIHDYGITITTLAILGDTPLHRQRIYELNKSTAADIPGRGPFYSFDEYQQQRFGHAGYRAEGVIVAIKQEEWVGFTQVLLNHAEQLAMQEMTGVLRSYRGQQIARALKLCAIQYAQQQQMTRMATFNDTTNLPIVAINRALGYREEAGFYLLQAALPCASLPDAP